MPNQPTDKSDIPLVLPDTLGGAKVEQLPVATNRANQLGKLQDWLELFITPHNTLLGLVTFFLEPFFTGFTLVQYAYTPLFIWLLLFAVFRFLLPCFVASTAHSSLSNLSTVIVITLVSGVVIGCQVTYMGR